MARSRLCSLTVMTSVEPLRNLSAPETAQWNEFPVHCG